MDEKGRDHRKLYFLLDNKPINATTAYQKIGISGSAVYSPFFLCMFNFYFNLAKHRKKESPTIAIVKISLRRKCLPGIFTCSHITLYYGLKFLFSLVSSINQIIIQSVEGLFYSAKWQGKIKCFA